jgi:hypothetical protein
MRLFARNHGKKTRGQTMVEFALILPVLLLTMYGVMELGRLLFIYVATTSASREAARYASGTELVNRNGVFVERFRDCAGIRQAAQRVGILAGIDEILIQYDSGPGTTLSANCTGDTWPDQRSLNDRVVVSVRGNYNTIVPMVPLEDRVIRSATARTIIRNVEVDVDFQPPPSVADDDTPPFVSFASYSSWINEGHGTYTVQVKLTDENGALILADDRDVQYDIGFTISGEADGSDFSVVGDHIVVFPVGQSLATISINIIDDLVYEYLERIVLHLSPYDGPYEQVNRIHPYAHVIYIQDNDPPPVVTFAGTVSNWPEDDPDHPGVIVNLIGSSVVPASVGVTLSGTAEEGVDYTIDNLTYNSETGQYRMYFDSSPSSQSIVITTVIDALLEGPETIIFTLTNPVNATLGGITNHTLILRDYQCDIQGFSPRLVGNQYFRWDLLNNGALDASLSQVTVSYTSSANTRFSDVTLAGSNLWSGSVNQNPATAPSSPGGWILGSNPTMLSGASKVLQLGFRDAVITGITNVNVTFNNGCPPISTSNILPPPP